MVELEDLHDPADREILRDTCGEVYDLTVIEELAEAFYVGRIDGPVIEREAFCVVERGPFSLVEIVVISP